MAVGGGGDTHGTTRTVAQISGIQSVKGIADGIIGVVITGLLVRFALFVVALALLCLNQPWAVFGDIEPRLAFGI
jgi:hypothetical protein